MKILGLLLRAASAALLCLIALAAAAADYPAPNEGDWIARDFRFHTGDVMPELRLHYTTVGAPSGVCCGYTMHPAHVCPAARCRSVGATTATSGFTNGCIAEPASRGSEKWVRRCRD